MIDDLDMDLTPVIAEQPDPLLFATVSGAHLYGFPSQDSDPRASRLDHAGLAGSGTAPRRVVVGCHGSAMSPSSALRCTAPDPAP